MKHYDRLAEERGGFGGWRPRLLELSPRWQWYSRLIFFKEIPKDPFPQIHFIDDHDGRARRLVDSCLRPFSDVGMDELLKFLLNRFGYSECRDLPPLIKKHHVEHWEATFDVATAISLDRDVFGDAYSDCMGKGLRSGTGYFPTPISVCRLIADMTLTQADLFSTVHDPCVGSGRMLLPASNRSLFLSGMDVNPVCIRMTLVNGFLFAPQIVIPPPAELRPQKSRKVVIPRNTLMRLSAELEEVGHGSTTRRFQSAH
ncbi:MAG: N-6 DNA methylase [Bdellovibrionaceae bacterium]|nr:N-6 DNA methylase [Pseudobdellovibrionaceae bacterium]